MVKFITKYNDIDFGLLKQLYRQRLEDDRHEWHSSKSQASGQLIVEQDFFYDIRTFMELDGAIIAVAVMDDVYVSCLRLEPYADGYLLSCLETDPSHRNRGFAKHLIFSTVDYLRQIDCKRLYSHVSVQNRPSLSVHYAAGFQKIYDYAKFLDNTVSTNSVTLCISIDG